MKALSILPAIAMTVAASAANPIPLDPAVRTGSLPNGLTYYIQQNDTPAGQADFFLAQRVGSVNEDDGQEGLAHFLEHMCFNGTAHFPGNSLISYLESLGVKFGRNLNAYTSTDETVYNICQVPAARSSALDSCVMILSDWSGRLLLNDDDIDAERGVILGEMRQRSTPGSRILTRLAPEIYSGSIYGRRMPIGLADVVANFEPDTLRAYYRKWYHPGNQAVIVVGDVDPDFIESAIRRHFADIRADEHAAVATPPEVPDNDTPIAVCGSDPEQPHDMIQLYIKEPVLAPDEKGTIAEVRHNYTGNLIVNMLVDRLDSFENKPDCPWSNLGIGYSRFLLSGTRKALMFRATADNADNARRALACFNSELLRAAVHGFTETELNRAKLSERSLRDSKLANAPAETNTAIARRYANHFTRGDFATSTEQMYKIMNGVERTTGLADVNARMAALVRPDGRNTVTAVYATEADAPAIAATVLPADIRAIDPATLDPFTDTFAGLRLMDTEPAPGTIISDTDGAFGTRLLKLANGIKVYLRHNDAMPDEVLIHAVSPGGISMHYDPAKKGLYKMADDILPVSGFGGHSAVDLRKLTAGHTVKSAVRIGNTSEELIAATTPADLETALALLYLKATAINRDDNAFGTLMAATRSRLSKPGLTATIAMGDSIHSYVYNRHPLGEKLKAADLDAVDCDSLIALHRDRFGDMSDFTYIITGNFDTGAIDSLVAKYIASLPGAGRTERPRDTGYGFFAGEGKECFTHPAGENPVSITYSFFTGECGYTLENVLAAQTFGSILKSRLLDEIREKRGLTYGINTHCSVTAGFNGPHTPPCFIMPVYIKVTPGHEEETFAIVRSTIADLMAEGPTPEELAKVKAYLLKSIAENRRSNSYWETVVKVFDQYGPDMDTGYESTVNAMTPATIRNFARRYFATPSHLELAMSPSDE